MERKGLIVDREKLVAALLDFHHVAGELSGHVVAFPPEGGRAKVISDRFNRDGNYFESNVGDVVAIIHDFLDDGDGTNDFAWGEQGEGSGPGGEWTEEDDAAAKNRIEECLRNSVEIDGEKYAVNYD